MRLATLPERLKRLRGRNGIPMATLVTLGRRVKPRFGRIVGGARVPILFCKQWNKKENILGVLVRDAGRM